MALYYYFLTLLLIEKIISDCFNRCSSCSLYGINIDNQLCDTCINNTYLMNNTQNCFYIYEQPNFYIDYSSHKLNQCPTPCYECTDNSINNCLSCLRGYFYNKVINKCEQCPTNKYIFIEDSSDRCKKIILMIIIYIVI